MISEIELGIFSLSGKLSSLEKRVKAEEDIILRSSSLLLFLKGVGNISENKLSGVGTLSFY